MGNTSTVFCNRRPGKKQPDETNQIMNTFAKTKVVNSYDKPPEMFPRNFKPVIAVALGVVGFGLSSPGRVEAVPSPQMHEMSGKVQRIDRETITIGAAGESRSCSLGTQRRQSSCVMVRSQLPKHCIPAFR